MEYDAHLGLAIAVAAGILFCLGLYSFLKTRKHAKKDSPSFELTRAVCNPILTPDQHWEESGTFNPGVFKDENGFHILYRAIGGDGVSRIGYARSTDGITIDERLPYPIFSLQYLRSDVPETYSMTMYPSGGSWGGCEDPRAVIIDGRMYMTFNAFQDWGSIRIGIVSMSVEDFQKGNWKWSTPLLISPKDEQNKNWVLFPEKINGKFAILHSVTPTVLVDYVDTLEELAYGSTSIKSRIEQKPGDRSEHWDSKIRGAGPPPIRTNKGWLLLYHANSSTEGHLYKLGALLLDIKDPSKVIARSPSPILVPDEWYENDWKPGIVYACGATVHDDTLSVFYGGGDKYLCVAHASLSLLLDWMVRYGATRT